MPRWVLPLLIFSVVAFCLEFYTFQALKTTFKSKYIRIGLLAISLIVYSIFFFKVFTYDRSDGQSKEFQQVIGLLFVAIVPKLIILIVLFGEDVVRWIQNIWIRLSNSDAQTIQGRRKFISQLALGIASIPFASILYLSLIHI